MSSYRCFAKNILDKSYRGEPESIPNGEESNSPWETTAPLPPDLIYMCLEYVISQYTVYYSEEELKEYYDGYWDNVIDKSTLRVRTQGFVVDGNMHGEWKSYHENGQLEKQVFFVHGNLHGECTSWYSTGLTPKNINDEWKGSCSGIISIQEHFTNGNYDGDRTIWFRNGVPFMHQAYKNGKKHGEQKEWYESGKLKSRERYVNNRLYGQHKTWYESGALFTSAFYVKGRFSGPFRTWSEDGTMISEVIYSQAVDNSQPPSKKKSKRNKHRCTVM